MAGDSIISTRSDLSGYALTHGGLACGVDVYLDGFKVPADVYTSLHPSDIAGVELYSMGFAPVQYRTGSRACHVLLLWSRVLS